MSNRSHWVYNDCQLFHRVVDGYIIGHFGVFQVFGVDFIRSIHVNIDRVINLNDCLCIIHNNFSINLIRGCFLHVKKSYKKDGSVDFFTIFNDHIDT